MKEFIYSTSTNPHQVLIDFLKWKRANNVVWNETILLTWMESDDGNSEELPMDIAADILANAAESALKPSTVPDPRDLF